MRPRFLAPLPTILALGLLLTLAAPVRQVWAATPTQALQTGSYYWTGDLLGSPHDFPDGMNENYEFGCKTGEYLVGTMAVVYPLTNVEGGIIYDIAVDYFDPEGSNLTNSIFSRTIFENERVKTVYVTINRYFGLPPQLEDDLFRISANNSNNENVLVVTGVVTGEANRARISIIDPGQPVRLNTVSALCFIPPALSGSPTLTPTPAYQLEITQASGTTFLINREISYGDVAVVLSVTALIVVILFTLWFLVPKTRAK